mmetsp:Transcript_9828/g.23673  ORF Transcript_9828/g.23673 Transcript_9828/m.23673 type:complete len:164 (+) Transcript_9828:243-734(+)
MLVLYDETLLGRLWCVLEIFAFFTTAAHAGGTFVVLPLKPRSTLPPPAHSLPSPTKPATPVRSTIRRSTASVSSLESGGEAWRSSFLDMLANFDARNAVCSVSSDREVLLDLIGAYPGGIEQFNTTVRAQMSDSLTAQSAPRAWRAIVHVSPSGPEPALERVG